MKRNIVIIAIMVLMTSCGIYKPYKRPEISTDNLFVSENSSDITTIGDIAWNEIFSDPYLQDLINKGLENNADLQIARFRISAAEASLMAAKLAYLPSLSINPQGTISSFDGNSAVKTYQLPANASWELDIFGKLSNARKQQKARLEESLAYKQVVQTQLISNIANTYYTLLMLDKQLDISEQTIIMWEKNIKAMQALKNAGQANEAGVSQAEANKYKADGSIVDLRRQINEVELALCSLLGETPHKIIRSSLEEQSFPKEFSIGVPLQLLSNRPDVKSAEARLKNAFYATNEARSYFYPNITLSGNLGWTNNSGGAITNPGAMLWQVMGSLTQPLFNKGTNSARLKIAKAQQEEAQITFQQTLLDAGIEVNNALALFQSSEEKRNLFQKQIEALQITVNSTQLLMQHSNTTYLEVLTAQQNLLQAQLLQVANDFDKIQGFISMYRTLGGGR